MQLTDPVNTLAGVGDSYAQKLKTLNIITINDLLYHIPHRYLDFRNVSFIRNTQIDDIYTLTGTVTEIETTYTRKGKRITKAVLTDDSGSIQLVWFNQTYLTKVISTGDSLRVAGKISWWDRQKAIIAPMWKKSEDLSVEQGDIVPIYPETEGITSNWLSKTIERAWENAKDLIIEHFPSEVLGINQLPTLQESLSELHFPSDPEKAEQGRKRLAFDEMLALQKDSRERRRTWDAQTVTFSIDDSVHSDTIVSFISRLPFSLTDAQHRVIKELLHDMTQNKPMNRLLQGDVGAGKTVVAATGAVATHAHGKQTIILAPTEVLAQQHAQTLNELFEKSPITIALVTGSTKTEDFSNADIIVGTHALFNQKDVLSPAGFIVIDEQHKFGVEQRELLIKGNDTVPHVLTMTATPIPRSIALTLYGDQDVSLLDEMPPGRLPVKTWVVPEVKRQDSYAWIAQQLETSQRDKEQHNMTQSELLTIKNDAHLLDEVSEDSSELRNKQAIFVYPLIEESDHETMSDVKAVTKEYEKLTEQFSGFSVALIHGRMSAKEKNGIIEQFRGGNIDILVTTSVIEVGIDAPGATIIVIENAERFGLATLHQLRGRVGRRGQQAYCFLYTPSNDETTLTRLKAMETHHNGLKLAEIDLELRGPGQLFGTRQHGLGELRFAKVTDLELIRQVRETLDVLE